MREPAAWSAAVKEIIACQSQPPRETIPPDRPSHRIVHGIPGMGIGTDAYTERTVRPLLAPVGIAGLLLALPLFNALNFHLVFLLNR